MTEAKIYEPFKETVCAMCGKKYIKRPGSIYTVQYKGKQNQCCSYTCYMKAIRLKERLAYEKTDQGSK